jgi:hypothetical protein
MVIYKCDLCKKECEHIITIQVPVNKNMYAMSNGNKLATFKYVDLSNLEICPTCAVPIADFLDSLCRSS